jgi:hypothetical protein
MKMQNKPKYPHFQSNIVDCRKKQTHFLGSWVFVFLGSYTVVLRNEPNPDQAAMKMQNKANRQAQLAIPARACPRDLSQPKGDGGQPPPCFTVKMIQNRAKRDPTSSRRWRTKPNMPFLIKNRTFLKKLSQAKSDIASSTCAYRPVPTEGGRGMADKPKIDPFFYAIALQNLLDFRQNQSTIK